MRFHSPKQPSVGTVLWTMGVLMWVFAAIILKVEAAEAGAFTSDLYDYHTSLRSTVDGSFFRSYIYGNVMGDHGYLALFLLLPAYAAAPSASFWLLVMATPLVAVISIAAVRSILVDREHPHPNLVAGSLLLIPGFFWLVHEPIYGFHPDTLAGPLLVAAAIGLDFEQFSTKDLGTRLGAAAFFLFVILKEETALIGILFAIPFVLRPATRRVGLALMSFAGIATFASFSLMRASRTPFNRGNETLFRTAIDRLTLSEGSAAAWGVALPIAVGVILVLGGLAARNRLRTSDLAVVTVFGAKIASLGLLFPLIPAFSWHLSIPICAAWYLVYRVSSSVTAIGPKRRHVAFACAALALAGIALVDVAWYSGYGLGLADRGLNAAAALEGFSAFDQTSRGIVVSVPPYDLHAWRDRDATPLPRGLTLSPRGIGDAVVTESNGRVVTSQGVFDMHQVRTDSVLLSECFTLVATSEARELWIRTADCGLEEERNLFDATVGLP